ncbi:hypothetical protein M409DRAFT_60554 [Zasmidium cellare ATCC 36951]|uniref:F-box domain-containing protein n=1 Tax=Zasmidium cellare ATCC 36951 TaxID=1080233 RepID=A0A6A6BYA9_ZASCE|nr:uncharacterized protein M409DRAFT_60554 [Zasmidium cellare ATCC 36951]KAF2159787.1 hypothetical protein M409DRAFT_60554 [Zasmidium cellare ATCC 36951]
MATTPNPNMQDIYKGIATLPQQDSQPWQYNDIEMVDYNAFEACHKALGTVEILEEILTHLPKFQLFRIQKVSMAFRDTIQESPQLQERMMLKAPVKSSPRPRGCSNGVVLNDILRDTIFLPRLAIQEGFTDGIHAMYGHRRLMHENLEDGELTLYRYREMQFSLPEKNYIINLAKRDASWRKMLVAKEQLPPFRTQMLMWFSSLKESDNNKEGFGEERMGFVTMGDVADAVEKEYNEYWWSKANGINVRGTLREADDYLDHRTGITSRGLQHRI